MKGGGSVLHSLCFRSRFKELFAWPCVAVFYLSIIHCNLVQYDLYMCSSEIAVSLDTVSWGTNHWPLYRALALALYYIVNVIFSPIMTGPWRPWDKLNELDNIILSLLCVLVYSLIRLACSFQGHGTIDLLLVPNALFRLRSVPDTQGMCV